jgi:phospholipase/carboxylesterase
MSEEEFAAIRSLLNPLLRAFEMLMLIARHLHPPDFLDLMRSIGTPDEALRAVKARQLAWPQRLPAIGAALDGASDAALQAFIGLRAAQHDIRDTYRALRLLPQGLEALYPLAGILSPVHQFFLDPSLRSKEAMPQFSLQGPARDRTGVMHFAAAGAERGGFWLYVPEHYAPDRAWPLVTALHGGSGTGRQFLWNWLRDARSRGAILVAPTSVQRTWALLGPDPDTPNLLRILEFITQQWNVDAKRLLLTGMSDGGTFTYASGLRAQSPFTHLAPVAAAFHPMLVELGSPSRVRGLPIHIIHGRLDWMFPAELARQAHVALASAGAAVSYREVDDLSHSYPGELNAVLLSWLEATPAQASA